HRLVAADRSGYRGRVSDVGLVIARGRHHSAPGIGREFSCVAIELRIRPVSELLIVPVLPAHADQLEPVSEMCRASQGGAARQQLARGQVAGPAGAGEARDHVAVPALARASVTPLAITPMWLKAWGKLPTSSPVVGLICSDSRPSGLAREHKET